jgi:hypothetical protein
MFIVFCFCFVIVIFLLLFGALCAYRVQALSACDYVHDYPPVVERGRSDIGPIGPVGFASMAAAEAVEAMNDCPGNRTTFDGCHAPA